MSSSISYKANMPLVLPKSPLRRFWRKISSAGIAAVFFLNAVIPAGAQSVFSLPAPGVRVSTSPPFSPSVLKGIKVYPANPFRFDFILEQGDAPLDNAAVKEESARLIKYFLASLTVPEKDLWVNLSPYEHDRIIPDQFGKTEMGRDLLAEDYLLKQITASLIYPEDEFGRKFWKRVYEEAAQKFHTTEIPINTFNKVWIVPQKAVVYENEQAAAAYVVESRLKVMLEEDYVALAHGDAESQSSSTPESSGTLGAGELGTQRVNALGSQIVREIVIPELEKEVNEGKNFAKLRQVYHSLILAAWYKKKIKDSVLAQVYADQNKVTGVTIDDPDEKQKIYDRYLEAFKKGVYNYIKEDVDALTQEPIPRKYFSGGVSLSFDSAMLSTTMTGTGSLLEIIRELDLTGARQRDSRVVSMNLNIAGGPEQQMTGTELPLNEDAAVGSGPVEAKYIRNRPAIDRYMSMTHVKDRLIAPGFENFDRFSDVHAEVQTMVVKMLRAQGIDPQGYKVYLTDTVEPNAAVLRYSDIVYVNMGLVRMLAAKKSMEDALAFVVAHEIRHIRQMRDNVDQGKVEEQKGPLNRWLDIRGNEYEADLQALRLMDLAGYSVKGALDFFADLTQWMKDRNYSDFGWGTHPQLEERGRKLRSAVLGYHWKNYGTARQEFSAQVKSQASQRTDFRSFQESVINVPSLEELKSLLEQAPSAEELQFALLVGHEMLSSVNTEQRQELKTAFEQRLQVLTGDDQARQVLNRYLQDDIFSMIDRSERYGRLQEYASLAAQLPSETMLRVIELGLPALFALKVDVDELSSNDRYQSAARVLERLANNITSMDGKPQMPSDRFNMFATGFIIQFVSELLKRASAGNLGVTDQLRLLRGLTELKLQADLTKIVGADMRVNSNIYKLVSMLLRSDSASQLTAEQAVELTRIYDGASSYGTGYTVEGGAEDIYAFLQKSSPAAKQAVLDWLYREEKVSALKNQIVLTDFKRLQEGKPGVLNAGTLDEYLDRLLAAKHIVQSPRIFEEFLKKFSKQASAAQQVSFHQLIFRRFRELKVQGDIDVYLSLLIKMRDDPTMFNNDVFEEALLQAVNPSVRPEVKTARADLKRLFYIFALGGTLSDDRLRSALFDGRKVRERPGSMLQDSEIIAMINRLSGQQNVTAISELSDLLNGLSEADSNSVWNRWDEINPEREILNLELGEFALVKSFFESIRNELGQQLVSKQDAKPEDLELAFGAYTTPVYLQALFNTIGYTTRLSADDVAYASSAWGAFAGDVSMKSASEEYQRTEAASKTRPQRTTRIDTPDVAYKDFVALFGFIQQLPASYAEAVEQLTTALPPSVFRNFVLYMLFIERVVTGTHLRTLTPEKYFDLNALQNAINSLDTDQRAAALSDLQRIIPLMVPDTIIENSNKTAVTWYVTRQLTKKQASDEARIRQEHAVEEASYEDASHTALGGAVGNLQIFAGRLAEPELRRVLSQKSTGLDEKRQMIEQYFPQSSTNRDEWLKRALDSSVFQGQIEAVERLLNLFENPSLRDNVAMRAIDEFRRAEPQMFDNLDSTLAQIQRFFPQASLIRDDLLMETAQHQAHTPQMQAQVEALLFDPFAQPDRLREEKAQRVAFGHDVLRGVIKKLSAQEKSEFLLWQLGISDQKPFSLVEFEYNFHVNFNSLRTSLLPFISEFYPQAGQSQFRQEIEPFLYGEKGIFSDTAAKAEFLDRFFDGLVPQQSGKRNILRTVYKATFKHASSFRQEEIFIALTWALSKERRDPNADPEVREARIIRYFLESLGLGGKKLAQILSRSPSVSKVVKAELAKVQDRALGFPKGVVFDLVEKIYGSFDRKFSSIEEPLGIASIKGVYKGTLLNGRKVVVKVKRPEVEKLIEEDLAFLKAIFAEIQPDLQAEGVPVPRSLIAQMEASIRRELDFDGEVKNTEQLRSNIMNRSLWRKALGRGFERLIGTIIEAPEGKHAFIVPEPIEVANDALIIEEWIDGTGLSNTEELMAQGFNPSDMETASAREFLRQVFVDGFYHMDPHLGNILIDKQGRIVLIDAGAAASISWRNRLVLARLLYAVENRNMSTLQSIIEGFGGTVDATTEANMKQNVIDSTNDLTGRVLWFFQILEDAQVPIPDELLSIFRFFGAGGELFAQGKGEISLDAAMMAEVEAVPEEDVRAADQTAQQSVQQDIKAKTLGTENGQVDRASLSDGKYMGLVTDVLLSPKIESFLPITVAPRGPSGEVTSLLFMDYYGTVGDQLKRFGERNRLSFSEVKRLFGEKLYTKFQEFSGSQLDGRDWVRLTMNKAANALDTEYASQIRTSPQTDHAAMAAPGGIDFNPTQLNLEIQNNGQGIKFDIDPAMLEQLKSAPGFTPVIINIQPISDLPLFLGLSDENSQQTASL